jgi:predicted MPP superfamily phosphohydrolase
MKNFPSAGFAALSLAMSLGGHLVVLSWARRAFAPVERAKRGFFALCVVVAAVPLASRYLTMKTRTPLSDGIMAASLLELTFVIVLAFPLLALRLASRTKRGPLPEAETDPVRSEANSGARVDRRQALETLGGAVAIGGTGLVVGWGATVGRHDYRVYEVPVRIPGLPRALDGYVIAQISDIHGGLFTGERELREGASRIRSFKPDLVVATGDLVDFDPRHAPEVGRTLADLGARDGTFAILGNHDYYSDADAVSEAIRAAGVSLLVNEGRTIRAGDGGGFALLGLDDQWSHRYGGPGPRFARALSDVAPGAPRILLSHQPDTFEHYAGRVALQLSGHTHGGQIRPANLLLPWVAGRYERDGSTLYVNRGFGVAGPPARLGVPPEITKIILIAA